MTAVQIIWYKCSPPSYKIISKFHTFHNDSVMMGLLEEPRQASSSVFCWAGGENREHISEYRHNVDQRDFSNSKLCSFKTTGQYKISAIYRQRIGNCYHRPWYTISTTITKTSLCSPLWTHFLKDFGLTSCIYLIIFSKLETHNW